MKRLASLLLLSAFSLAACNKDDDFQNAVVRDSGDVSNSGCGYLLDVENEGEQKPEYLPSAFQHEGMRVKVKYTYTGVLDTCGHTLPQSFHELVRIDDIKRADD
jgi:hypothetical protein